MTQGCVMTLTQGHISKVMVTVHTYPKTCPGHKFSLPSWILIIYHVIISWLWLRDILPRSRSQFTHGNFFFSRPLPFMGPLDGDDTSHNCCPWPRGCCCCCWGICPVRTCLVWVGFKHFLAGFKAIPAYGLMMSVCLSVCLSVRLSTFG